MPLYKLALRFAHDVTWGERRRWSTTFFVEASNPTAAASFGTGLWISALRPATADHVFCYEAYATDLDPSTEAYDVVAVPSGQQRGTNTTLFTAEKYLLKACLAVEMKVTASRPSRKFWRPGLTEGTIVGGTAVSEDVLTATRAAWENLLTAGGTFLRDPDGQSFSSIGTIKLTTREFGREAGSNLPTPPAVG